MPVSSVARYSERELYAMCLKVYDVGDRPIEFTEFAQDVSRLINFCKLLKQNKILDKEYNLRMLLNWMIISFNIFGMDTVNILFTIADEMIYPDIISFLTALDRYPAGGVAVTIHAAVIRLDQYVADGELLEKLRKEIES